MNDQSWEAQAPVAAGSGNRWLAYGVALIGVFMTLLDATIVNVAIAPIERSLNSGYSAVAWVLAGYALAFGLLVIPGGRLGDRFGHKRIFLIGLAGFTVASVLCAVSVSAGELIAWRVVQGAMAGLINPAILGIIEAMFAPRERGKAYGLYGATAGLASALGPLVGGLLIAWNFNGWDWRPVFFINAPLGIAACVGAALLLPEARGRAGGLDPLGIFMVSAAFLLLTFPLVEGQQLDWPAWTFVMLGGSVLAFALFTYLELRRARRGRTPLVPMGLFRIRPFAAGVTLSMFFFAGFTGLLFAMSLYLQIGFARSALYTGLSLLPFAAGSFGGAAASDAVTHRIGRTILHLGAIMVIVGLVGIILTIRLADTTAGATAVELLPSMLVAGIGTGFIIAPSTGFALAAVPWQDVGSAGGVLNASLRCGQAIGVAVTGVALFTALANHAAGSATQAVPQLSHQLSVAGTPPRVVSRETATFASCFQRQAHATDPTAVPPGCPSSAAGRTGAAFMQAAGTALHDNYTAAMRISLFYPLGALVLTFLLVFLDR